MTPTPVVFAVALAAAALMGLAIQRGATCMVAAVDELVSEGRARRAYALAEAALWVGGLSSIALMLHWLNMSLGIYRVTGWTVAGGVMLGIGAWINRACVFGAVARIGSGQWAWIATPVGFFIGCLFPVVAPEPYAVGTAAGSPTIATVTILAFLIFAVWRLVEALHSQQITVHLWHPHRATLLIAVTFVVTLLTVGAWAYTDALAAIARNDEALLSLRAAMVAALLGGAILGGALAGKLRFEVPSLATVLRCIVGGMMMGIGARLVPGSNDGLILLGLPGLLPHAWVAVASMALSIAAAIGISRYLQQSGVHRNVAENR